MAFLIISNSILESGMKSKNDFINFYGAKYIGKGGVVLQKGKNDCGAASLKMIFNYFKINVDLSEISKKTLTKNGTNMLKIKKLAEEKGLKVSAYKMNIKDLKKVRSFAILHLKNDHFVVLDINVNKNIIILDPAIGKLSFETENFEKNWSGNILVFRTSGSIWGSLTKGKKSYAKKK